MIRGPSERPGEAFDRAADSLAGRLRGRPVVDRVAYALSEAANHSLLWHGINAADALVGSTARRRAALRRSILLAAEQALVNGPIKSAARRDRPPERDDHPHPLRTPSTSSFPSGHASAGACGATLLTDDLGAAPLWWGLALAVSWSRIHVGVHHASDVLGGLALGRALARGARVMWPSGADSRRSH